MPCRPLRLVPIALLLAACGGSPGDDAEPTGEDVQQNGETGPAGSLPEGDAGGGNEPAGDTWTSFAQGFFDAYCVSCHGAGNDRRDYTRLDDVSRDADSIRCGVAVEKQDGCGEHPRPQQFPVGAGPRPSDDDRERLVAWVDAGMPE